MKYNLTINEIMALVDEVYGPTTQDDFEVYLKAHDFSNDTDIYIAIEQYLKQKI